jgi:SAM-dependent methyltransferase
MRSTRQRILDFITFPLRAVTLFYTDKWGLSSLATERFDYVTHDVLGYCLDIGCGPKNTFINKFLNQNGIGIDVFKYEGLLDENIVIDMTHLPYQNETFKTVTFIANINHVPKDQRDLELSEAFRVLQPGGNIIVTMGNPLAELTIHKIVAIFDRIFKTHQDVDSERGMVEGEEYFLRESEIIFRLTLAGFRSIKKKNLHYPVGFKPFVYRL